MAIYITLVNFTEQGIRDIKSAGRRLDGARDLVRRFGGDIQQVYLTMGAYDLVSISEYPDDASAAKAALALGSLGNVRTTTLRAFDESEYREIIAALP